MENGSSALERERALAREAGGLQVRSLIRDSAPELRAALAERRLQRTVAEWAPGAGLDIIVATSPTSRRVSVDLQPLGDAPSSWRADVRGALAPIAELSPRRTVRGLQLAVPAELAEVVRDPTARSSRRIRTSRVPSSRLR